MTDTIQIKALRMLYSQLKQAKISLGQAEMVKNNHEELFNLAQEIDILEWIIGTVIESEDDGTGGINEND